MEISRRWQGCQHCELVNRSLPVPPAIVVVLAPDSSNRPIWGVDAARRAGQPQVLVGPQRQHAPARRAADEALLQQERLDDLLQRVARLRQGRRQRLDADRAAVVVAGDAGEVAVVERIEALAVDLELAQRPVGDLGGRRPCAFSTAAKSRTRRSRRPAMRGVPRERRAISAAPSGLMATLSTPAPRVTIVLELGVGVEVEAHGDAEAVAQRRGEQARARGGADQREAWRGRS